MAKHLTFSVTLLRVSLDKINATKTERNKMRMTFNQVKEAWFQESDLIINATENQIEKLGNFLDDNDYVNTVDERLYNINEEANYLLHDFLKYG